MELSSSSLPKTKSHWALLIVLLGLVGLSWAGTLDTISSDYVNASILDAGIIYGTARGSTRWSRPYRARNWTCGW